MPILETFQQAILDAMAQYQLQKTEKHQPLSETRKKDIQHVLQIVEKSKTKNQRDAFLLRENVVNFVKQLKVHPLANAFPLFDSDFRKAIKAVLDDPAYSASLLMAKERAEAKERQEAILPYLQDTKKVHKLLHTVDVLKEQLASEKFVSEQLKNKLNTQTSLCNKLIENVKTLNTQNTQRQSENATLTLENAALKAEIDRLKQSTHHQKSSKYTDHHKTPTPVPQPFSLQV